MKAQVRRKGSSINCLAEEISGNLEGEENRK